MISAYLLVIVLGSGPLGVNLLQVPDLPSEGSCRQLYKVLKDNPETGWIGERNYSCTLYQKVEK